MAPAIETFTSDLLPGLTGIMWGGFSFTVYTDRARAEEDGELFNDFLAVHAEDESNPEYTQVVERRDGRFLLAKVDPSDKTFRWVNRNDIPGVS